MLPVTLFHVRIYTYPNSLHGLHMVRRRGGGDTTVTESGSSARTRSAPSAKEGGRGGGVELNTTKARSLACLNPRGVKANPRSP